MKTKSKLLGLALILGLSLFSSAQAQLLITNQGVTAIPSAVRANAADVATLLSSGLSSFTLNSLGSAGTFSQISIFADEFRVGFNGTFNVSLEVSYIARDALDNDQLGVAFGAANNTYSAGDSNTALFTNYGVNPSLNTFSITGFSTLIDIANFFVRDLSFGTSADQTNPNFFQWYLATDDPNYNYYVFRIDDRGSTSYTDFNDGVFLARINTAQVAFEPVPEPTTYGLMASAGLAGLVALRRRSRKASAVSVSPTA